MLKNIFVLTLILTTAQAWAQTPPAAPEKESDKLDIKKLEDQYWSSKDDDFSVVQNRTFSKEKKWTAAVSLGIPINDPYSSGSLQTFALGYHFSERLGVEAGYQDAIFKHNEATSRFVNDHGTIPNHNQLDSQTFLQMNYVPLYAKMSFLDKKIIYFDMGTSVGIGQTSYISMINTGNKTYQGSMVSFSLYQHYFLKEWLAIKVEYRNTWTMEKRFRYKMNPGEPESNRSLSEKSINDSSLMLGLTFFK